MSRRADPDRLHQARRQATSRRLEGTGASPEMAERWVAAWEVEGNARGLAHDGAFWQAGWTWIIEGRSARKEPA